MRSVTVTADTEVLVVEFRVTVGLGQDTVDTAVLDARAAALQRQLTDVPGAGSGPVAVVVDPVKAAVQVVVGVDAGDALTAAQRALAVTSRALHDTGLAPPATIVTAEAEAVPDPAVEQPRQPHPVAAPAGSSDATSTS